MDILDIFGHFYLNHLSPLWGYFSFRRQADLPNMTREQATQNVAMDTEDTKMKGLKRPAISKVREDSISEMEKSAKRSRANSSLTGFTTTSGSRNAIDCSFSSSRRWLEKQVCCLILN